MSILIACPQATNLESLPVENCLESVGQIQKVVITRIFSAPQVLNSFTIASANPNLLASWAPKLVAADSTKVVVSPYIQAPVTEPGAARTYGGGNETVGGVELIIGTEPTTFTANMIRLKQSIIKTMKKYMGENIGVYLIDEHNRIIGLTDNHTTPTMFYPIPIAGLFIGDKNLGGLDGIDMNALEWKFFANWSDMLHIVTPTDFKPLTGL